MGFIKKNFVDFQNLMEIEFCRRLIFESLIIHKPSLQGSCEAPQKKLGQIGSAVCRRFLDTNSQTKNVCRYMKSKFILRLEQDY